MYTQKTKLLKMASPNNNNHPNSSPTQEITETQAWNLAYALITADLEHLIAILSKEIPITSRDHGDLLPIKIEGPSHPRLQALMLFRSTPTTTTTLLQAFLQIKLMTHSLPPNEIRIMWLNGSLEQRIRPLITSFKVLFKTDPSPTKFAHMAVINRVSHQILIPLDIEYPSFLEAPNPEKASTTTLGTCITILTWSMPPKNVDPVKKWNPEEWPKWHFWTSVNIVPPKPRIISVYNPSDNSTWISKQRVADRIIIRAL